MRSGGNSTGSDEFYYSNSIPLGPFDPFYRGTFDVCLKSLSYSTSGKVTRDTVTKKRDYAQGGVKEYYLLDARGQQTTFYQLTEVKVVK